MKTNDKIDIVILWVDDEDQEWLEKKETWQEKCGIINNQPERYRNWDNLHFMFRSIEKYASWVNHIYIVTDKQKPNWLNIQDNNITIVDHEEIMDAEDLPTFNSSAIELNIHKIPGLSENFVYFNDDMFLIDYVQPEDFFIDGVPKEMAALNLIMPSKINRSRYVMFNNVTLINDTFDKKETLRNKPFKWINYKNGLSAIRTLLLLPWSEFSNFKQTHLPASHKKSTYTEIWTKYEKELKKSTSYKFRSLNNYNQWLIKDWQLAANNFLPQDLKFGKVYQLYTKDDVSKCVEHIEKSKTKVICVNDNEYLEDFPYAKSKVNKAFEVKYPVKSKYEL